MKHLKTIFVGLVLTAAVISCQKSGNFSLDGDASRNPGNGAGDGAPSRTLVTINANLPDGGLALAKASIGPRSGNEVILIDDFGEEPETKVSLIQDEEQVKVLKPSWEENDKILVNGVEFTLTSGEGTTGGVFVGGDPGAAPYNIQLVSNKHMPADFNNQTQASDGSTAHLGYDFVMTGATCYGQDPQHAIQFTEDWAVANGATISNQPSVMRLRARLPASIANDVYKVVFTSSSAVLAGQKTLTVMLGTAGVQSGDNILDIYASLPYYSEAAAPVISDLLIQFYVDEDHAYDKYTFYSATNSGSKVAGGCTHVVNIVCDNIENNANRMSVSGGVATQAANIGTSANPYLVGDQHQMNALHSVSLSTTMTYIKMVDDIDMTTVTWVPLNKDYSNQFSFDGGNHTLSNVATGGAQGWQSIFGNISGTVENLTVNNVTLAPGSLISGVLASHLGTSSSSVPATVRNVTITNSSIGTSSIKGSNAHGIVAGVVECNGASLSNITVTNCTVGTTGTGAGILVGSAVSQVTASSCTVSNSAVYGSLRVGGLFGNLNTNGDASSSVTNCTVSSTNLTGAGRVGGFIGNAGNKGVSMSGCTFDGGSGATITLDPSSLGGDNPEKSVDAKYFGGAVGFVESNDATITTISDCHVTGDVTIDFTAKVGDVRGGGFVGQLYGNTAGTVRVAGCSVGTSSKKVLIETNVPDMTAAEHNQPFNVGGFVGVNYGIITKNGGTHSTAYAKITTNNTDPDDRVQIGGFAGYHRGTIEYCDAYADLSGLVGQQIGGFCGRLTQDGTISRNNTVQNTVVEGSSLVGGYVGAVNEETVDEGAPVILVSDCSVSNTTVTGLNSVGGFAGKFFYGTVSGADVTATVTGTDNVGGFAGEYDSTVSLSDCAVSSTAVSATAGSAGGFAGTALAAAPAGSDLSVSGGSVTATAYAGGFSANVGAVAFNDLLVDGCNVTSTCGAAAYEDSVGGLVANVAVAASFDNCTVQNLTVTANTSTSTHGIAGGAIGHLTGGATAGTSAGNHVTNVNIVGYDYVGGFAGLIQGSARVENNVVSGGTLGGNNNVGGFAGRCNPSTHRRNSTSMIVGSDAATRPGVRVGGYVGYTTNGTYTDCVASGDVTGLSTDVGGFVGLVGGGSFSGCTASGAVSSAGAGVGGFVGSVNKGTVPFTSCRYEGTSVTCTMASGSDVHTGGFCGRAATDPITVNWTDCRVQHPNNNQIYVTSTGNSWIGGFIGTAGKNSDENTGVITRCAVRNVRVTGGAYIGGFAGVSYMAISECWATGNQNATVTVTDYRGGGGFIGYLSRKPVSNCYTNAYIVANGQVRVGGFAGVILPSGSIVNSWVKTSIDWGTTRGGTTGCFAGNNQGGSTITDCIAWTSDSAPFCGASGTVSANCYKGVSAGGLTSISARAQSFGTWDTGIWNFEQSDPLLVNNMP